MDGPPFFVNLSINNTHYTKALIDSNCLYFATISASLAKRLNLPRIPITPRDLGQIATTIKGGISEVTYTDIDIDGF